MLEGFIFFSFLFMINIFLKCVGLDDTRTPV